MRALRLWPGFREPTRAMQIGRDGRGMWLPLTTRKNSLEVSNPASLAYILYTSGSTGVPKGVMLTHENATSFVDWCSAEFKPDADDRFSSHAPFHFDLSILDLYVPLKHGATLFSCPRQLGKSPQELAAFIAANRLTVWYSTPSILSLLAQFGALEKHDCSALRLVLFAGEVFPVKHLRSIVERWPQAGLYNLYGPTETNVCTFARIPPPVPAGSHEPYPIGPPCPHCRALVLDDPAARRWRAASEGLLHIAGARCSEGYWGRPDDRRTILRAKRPALVQHRGRRPGSRRPSGFVYIGRRDRMVKRRGYRIELGEIERGLYQHERFAKPRSLRFRTSRPGSDLAYLTPQTGRARRSSR